MTEIAQVIQTLKTDGNLTALLKSGARGIYHIKAPDYTDAPLIQYTLLSDNVVLNGDNNELFSVITLRFHVVTRQGAKEYNPISSRLAYDMAGMGWKRAGNVEQAENDIIYRVMDFKKEAIITNG